MIEGGEPEAPGSIGLGEYTARRKGQELTREELTQTEIVALTSLPCWESVSPEEHRRRVADLDRPDRR